jgi:hypothetical protein
MSHSTARRRDLISTTTEVPGAAFTRGRILWQDDTYTDFACLRCGADRLTLRDFDQRDPAPKLHMLSHVRFLRAMYMKRARPRVVAWLRLSEDEAAADCFPGISHITDEGETLLSANSLVTYTLRQLITRGWLHRRAGEWHSAVPAHEATWRARAEAIVAWLQRERRLHFYTAPWIAADDDDLADVHPLEDVIAIDRIGYVRELVWHENPLAAFNTAFFLLEPNDCLSHHSGLGEPFNLFVSAGEIQRPPLYPRATIYQRTDRGWETGTFGLADVDLYLGDGPTALPFTVDTPAAITAYTRRWAIPAHGRIVGSTPHAPERQEFTIVNRRVVSHKQGGDLEIPQNGFVLSCAPGALPDDILAGLMTGQVRYRSRHARHAGIRQALQAGPQLLADGAVSLTDNTLAEEAFWTDRPLPDGGREVGVVPTMFPMDVDRTRAGRVGVGVTAAGKVLVTVLVGSETGGVRDARLDSAGATLVELAEFMAEMGAVQAVNMDGGGSSQLFFLSGLATVAGGRLGLQSVHYERMVPSVGVIR